MYCAEINLGTYRMYVDIILLEAYWHIGTINMMLYTIRT